MWQTLLSKIKVRSGRSERSELVLAVKITPALKTDGNHISV